MLSANKEQERAKIFDSAHVYSDVYAQVSIIGEETSDVGVED